MRVIMIDDHALFRVGLQGLLEQRNIEVIAAIADGNEGIRLAQQEKPDVILLDLRMPDNSGLDILSKIRDSNIDIPVTILTTSNEEQDLREALKRGAQGYLLKDMEPDELVGALRDIVKGKNVVAQNMTDVLTRMAQGKTAESNTDPAFADLTPRETEILSLLAEGQSNKVIARNLGISDGTVKLHVKAILRKLKIHSRVEAAVIAVEKGLRYNKSSS